jgi:hypothetical protein
MFYVWIHRLLRHLGDLKVPFESVGDALTFGMKFVDAQKNSFYNPQKFNKGVLYDNGEFFIGGCDYTQVTIVTDTYEPENGWDFWANAYHIVEEEKAMILGGTGPAITPFASDSWEG